MIHGICNGRLAGPSLQSFDIVCCRFHMGLAALASKCAQQATQREAQQSKAKHRTAQFIKAKHGKAQASTGNHSKPQQSAAKQSKTQQRRAKKASRQAGKHASRQTGKHASQASKEASKQASTAGFSNYCHTCIVSQQQQFLAPTNITCVGTQE